MWEQLIKALGIDKAQIEAAAKAAIETKELLQSIESGIWALVQEQKKTNELLRKEIRHG